MDWSDKNFLEITRGNTLGTKNSSNKLSIFLRTNTFSTIATALHIWKIVSISLMFFWVYDDYQNVWALLHIAHIPWHHTGVASTAASLFLKREINKETQNRSIIFFSKYDFLIFVCGAYYKTLVEIMVVVGSCKL